MSNFRLGGNDFVYILGFFLLVRDEFLHDNWTYFFQANVYLSVDF